MYCVASFYEYENVESPEELRDQIRIICEKLELLGRILIATEGVNGCVSGRVAKVEEFKTWIKTELSPDLTFREQDCLGNAYHKLVVRVRDEIVRFKEEVNLDHRGAHITPLKLKEQLDHGETVVMLDARNDYEFEAGRFKGAITLPIKNFRDFPQQIDDLKNLKDEKMVMYCTGGVRCEKGSAYLKEHGFKDVSQLEGGIVNFVNQYPDTYFEGSCFVFDDRKTSKVSRVVISVCDVCNSKTDQMINCHNLDCDKLFLCCKSCQVNLSGTCGDVCKKAPRQRLTEKNLLVRVVGRVVNYYKTPGVALVKILSKNFSMDKKVFFVGKTTGLFKQVVDELRDYDGNVISEIGLNQLITLSVDEAVRKNDKVVLPLKV